MNTTRLPESKQATASADNSENGVSDEALALAEQLVQSLTHRVSSTGLEVIGRDRAVSVKVQVAGEWYALVCLPVQRLLAPTQLAPREWEIARRVAQGYRDSEIAQALGLKKNTIHTCLQRIFIKAGVNSRTELAAQLWAYDLLGGGRYASRALCD